MEKESCRNCRNIDFNRKEILEGRLAGKYRYGVSFVKADISAAYCIMTKSGRCRFVRAIVGIANRQMI